MTFLTVWAILLAPFLVPLMRWLESRRLNDSPAVRLGLETFAAVTIIITVGLTLHFIDHIPFRSLGLTARNTMGGLCSGLVLGAVMMTTVVLTLWLLGVARIQVLSPLSGIVLTLAGAAVFVNGITQELLFRGYILQTIERQSGSRRAVLLSAALFVAFHAPVVRNAWLTGANLYLAGVLLGAAYVLSRSLWLPIGIHFGWNVVQGPLLGLRVSGYTLGGWHLVDLQGPPILSGGTVGPEGGVIATGATLLGIAVLLIARRALGETRAA